MSVHRLRLWRIELLPWGGELPSPLGNARATWRERRGCLLHVIDEDGCEGFGEATPLPGFSSETLGECLEALSCLGALDLRIDLDAPLGPQLLAAPLPTPPAARFAAEAAILDVLGRRLRQPAWRLLRPGAGPAALVPLSALLPTTELEETMAAARAVEAAGFAALKLKVGRAGKWKEELSIIEALRGGSSLPLRLDANGAWPMAEAAARLEALRPFALEFVEEPFADGWPSRHPMIGEPRVSLAMDESLLRPDAEEWLRSRLADGLCQVLVLKPALLGGLARCLALGELASSAGASIVVTHLFDGPIAGAAAAQLALSLRAPPLPCGLAPNGALAAFPPWRAAALTSSAIVGAEEPGLGLEAPPDEARLP